MMLDLLHNLLFGTTPEPTEDTAECAFCHVKMELNAAIDAGWAPSYYNAGTEIPEPVCPACTSNHLRFNHEHGDFETIAHDATPVDPLPAKLIAARDAAFMLMCALEEAHLKTPQTNRGTLILLYDLHDRAAVIHESLDRLAN